MIHRLRLNLVYGTFSEEITAESAGRFTHWLDLLYNDNPKHDGTHLLFHSIGGSIVDANSMHNYVKGYPIPITMYNTGAVQSAAVLVYLTAARRIVCPYAKFLLHPASWKQTVGLNSEQHEIVTKSLSKNDKDIEEMLKTRLNMPPAKWEQAQRHQLEISAQEAVEFGLADEVGGWSVPKGASHIFSFAIPAK